MAFTIPEFPLVVDIYTMPLGVVYDFGTRVLRLSSVAQLRAWGADPRFAFSGFAPTGALAGYVSVLLPAGTDLRDNGCGDCPDLVELPSGSGRWYYVAYVDDVAKGFPNEYRQGILVKVFDSTSATLLNFPSWPTPIP